jgi:hypothetical protein
VWDWSFFEDGALALDRHELWEEIPSTPRLRLLQSPAVTPALQPRRRSVSVPRMPAPAPAPGVARRARRAERRAAHRLRRFAGLSAVAAIGVVTLLVTAFGPNGAATAAHTGPAPAYRLLPAGPPDPLIVATQGALRVQLPVEQNRVTAIGFHGAGDGALAFDPLGRRGNQGLLGRLAERIFGGSESSLVWYQLSGGSGPATSALDVGAAPGTDVYAPVDGTITGITDYVLSGAKVGKRIDIRPLAAPALIVSVTRLRPDPVLTVGSPVAAAATRLGTVLDLSHFERQALARYTQDAGNHVTLQVYLAAALGLP